ncbi:hypothetical protein AcW1_008533 [Taiwanofungus camphoratus]|nr:hypothetical protein AcV5_008818 [Antrodia cinnamomea]KAI0951499.1 hypothetical protein AcW1_008533 [Antrodia cinnamomea]KAI0956396.1 hypothetical protein AcV7_006815 [Antrodia cinnamomea]
MAMRTNRATLFLCFVSAHGDLHNTHLLPAPPPTIVPCSHRHRRPPTRPTSPALPMAGLAPYGASPNGTANGTSPSPSASPDAEPPHLHTPNRVLLLLDVQVAGLSDPPLGIPAARTIGANIACVLAHARAAAPRPLIVHVRNTGSSGDPDEPGTHGWQLVHAPLPGEPVLDKRKNNAFTGTRLGEIVPCDAELVVVGLQSDFCIRATCSAALARGNDVVLIRGAHATYDRLELWNGCVNIPAARVAREIEEELEEAGVVLFEMDDLPKIFGKS